MVGICQRDEFRAAFHRIFREVAINYYRFPAVLANRDARATRRSLGHRFGGAGEDRCTLRRKIDGNLDFMTVISDSDMKFCVREATSHLPGEGSLLRVNFHLR